MEELLGFSVDPNGRVAQQLIIRSTFPGNYMKIRKLGRKVGELKICLCRSATGDRNMGLIDT